MVSLDPPLRDSDSTPAGAAGATSAPAGAASATADPRTISRPGPALLRYDFLSSLFALIFFPANGRA